MSGRSVGRLASRQSPFTSLSTGFSSGHTQVCLYYVLSHQEVCLITACETVRRTVFSPAARLCWLSHRDCTRGASGMIPAFDASTPLRKSVIFSVICGSTRCLCSGLLPAHALTQHGSSSYAIVSCIKFCASKKHTSRSRFSMDECGVLNVCPYIRTAIPC